MASENWLGSIDFIFLNCTCVTLAWGLLDLIWLKTGKWWENNSTIQGQAEMMLSDVRVVIKSSVWPSSCVVDKHAAWDPSTLACDHALSLYLCNLCSGGGHDTFLSQITCKKARIWTFFWLDRKQYGWFALFRLAKTPPSVSCCWFQSAFLLA